MTTSPTLLTDALEQLVGPDHLAWVASWNVPRNPTADLDPETLLRSRVRPIPAHATYRRNVDHPREIHPDELGVATGDYRDDWSA